MTVFLLMNIFFATTVIAGNEVGNGGDAVICVDAQSQTTIWVADYYEFDEVRNLHTHTESDTQHSAWDLVENYLLRLEYYDLSLSEKLQTQWQEFQRGQFVVVPNMDLPDIDDSGFIPSQNHCYVKQLAIQAPSDMPYGNQILVNGGLWEKMSTIQQAGLILHEALFHLGLNRGQLDSARIRYFVSLVSSDQFSDLSLRQYRNEKMRAKLDGIIIHDAHLEYRLILHPMQHQEAMDYCREVAVDGRLLALNGSHISALRQPGFANFWHQRSQADAWATHDHPLKVYRTKLHGRSLFIDVHESYQAYAICIYQRS